MTYQIQIQIQIISFALFSTELGDSSKMTIVTPAEEPRHLIIEAIGSDGLLQSAYLRSA